MTTIKNKYDEFLSEVRNQIKDKIKEKNGIKWIESKDLIPLISWWGSDYDLYLLSKYEAMVWGGGGLNISADGRFSYEFIRLLKQLLEVK